MEYSKNKILMGIFILLAIFLFTVFLLKKDNESKICFDDVCFFVEIADNAASREVGLMNREILDENQGMLFIFENSGNYPFWMKNTLITLDIIWISESKEVVYIKNNAQPCESDPCDIIFPTENAKYVLEINSGLASNKGINVGSVVEFVKI